MIYLTAELRDITNEKIDLTPESLKVTLESDKKTYAGEITFYEEIDKDVKFKISDFPYNIIFVFIIHHNNYFKMDYKKQHKIKIYYLFIKYSMNFF